MGIFDWLRQKERPSSVGSSAEQQPQPEHASKLPTEQEQFQSPSLLAGWVNHFLLERMPLENNYDDLPDEESRKAFNITYEQRERYIREISVLRIAGISLFVKQYKEDTFWLIFSQSIYPLLIKYLNSGSYSTTVNEIAEAIESYVSASQQSDEEKVSSLYMRRVYDDSEHFLKLKIGGIGYQAVGQLMGSYEIFRDTYCQVTQGMPYKDLKLAIDAIEQAEVNGR